MGHDYTLWADWLRKNHHVRIGPGTSINPHAMLMDSETLTIGANCSISACTFVTHSGGDRVIRNAWGRNVHSQGPIVIGDNTTIGINVTIMYGVTVGDNCVIGAGSFVSRDVPSGTVMRPPEAVPSGTMDAYVERLAARTQARAHRPPTAAPATAPALPSQPIMARPIRVAFALMACALVVGPTSFFE